MAIDFREENFSSMQNINNEWSSRSRLFWNAHSHIIICHAHILNTTISCTHNFRLHFEKKQLPNFYQFFVKHFSLSEPFAYSWKSVQKRKISEELVWATSEVERRFYVRILKTFDDTIGSEISYHPVFDHIYEFAKFPYALF